MCGEIIQQIRKLNVVDTNWRHTHRRHQRQQVEDIPKQHVDQEPHI